MAGVKTRDGREVTDALLRMMDTIEALKASSYDQMVENEQVKAVLDAIWVRERDTLMPARSSRR
jgi:hypothetical protein